MSNRDFFIEAAQAQAAEIAADIAEIDAGLARCRADGDEHSARQLIQGRAEANAKRRNLEAEYQAYVASQQPRQEAPVSDAEFMAMSPERMLQHPETVDKIFSKSKYYSKDQWSDPEVASRVRAGLAAIESRKREEGR